MQPILFTLNRLRNVAGSQKKGVPPSMHGIFPLPPTLLYVNGVTRDSAGVVLGSVLCTLFRVDTRGAVVTYTQLQTTTSDVNGNYSFVVGSDGPYRVTFDLAGVPARAGITLATLSGTETLTPITTVTATGGTITIDGDYKIHTFTSSGVLAFLSAPTASITIEILGIAGAGGGGSSGGGGGAGGYHSDAAYVVSMQNYTVAIGGGGPGGTSSGAGTAGSDTTITPDVGSVITVVGGGKGGGQDAALAGNGGSGGGSGSSASPRANGTATGSEGHNGGTNATPSPFPAGGGGGSGTVGGNGSGSVAGDGGAGTSSSITGAAVTRAGGGGGGVFSNSNVSSGGSGGGGAGGPTPGAGTANTGSGGGGGTSGVTGGNGGSGLVIFRYKFQNIT